MKTAAIILLIMVGVIGNPAVVELQRGEVVFPDPEEKGKRANLFLSPEFDERKVSKFNKPKLQLKWAIVSGSLYEPVDRVRTRLRFNNEKWIDLYAVKNAQGSFDFSIVRLREFNRPEEAAIEQGELSDLRIVDWNHDRLLIKFTGNDKDSIDQDSDIYFRFDLTTGLPD